MENLFDQDVIERGLQSAIGMQLAKRNQQLGDAREELARQKAEIKSLTAALTDANDMLRRNSESAFRQIQESNARETQLEDALRAAGLEVPSVLDLDDQAVSS